MNDFNHGALPDEPGWLTDAAALTSPPTTDMSISPNPDRFAALHALIAAHPAREDGDTDPADVLTDLFYQMLMSTGLDGLAWDDERDVSAWRYDLDDAGMAYDIFGAGLRVDLDRVEEAIEEVRESLEGYAPVFELVSALQASLTSEYETLTSVRSAAMRGREAGGPR